FTKTLQIATRAGQDSDCNPATAGGILGTMLGYENIPSYWKQGLAEVEPMDFKYTTISLNDVYDMSFRHALEMIERNGGKAEGDRVTISVQKVQPVPLEQSFVGHFPVREIDLGTRLRNETTFEFEGIGFAVNGYASKTGDNDEVLE